RAVHAHAHDRALAVGPLDLRDLDVQRLPLLIRELERWHLPACSDASHRVVGECVLVPLAPGSVPPAGVLRCAVFRATQGQERTLEYEDGPTTAAGAGAGPARGSGGSRDTPAPARGTRPQRAPGHVP